MPKKISEKILQTLEGESFARWYQDVFVPEYIEESNLSKEQVLDKIEKLFDLKEPVEVTSTENYMVNEDQLRQLNTGDERYYCDEGQGGSGLGRSPGQQEAMRLMAPRWAIQLTAVVCSNYGKPLPRVAWGRSKTLEPFGRWFKKPSIVAVFEGEDQIHTKCVLLHELGHHLLNNGRHNDAFYHLMERLYRTYGVPSKVACQREGVYPEHWDTVGWSRKEKEMSQNYSQYYITGNKAKQALRLPGVHLRDDWGDGTYNVLVEEDQVDHFIQWCEDNQVTTKLI